MAHSLHYDGTDLSGTAYGLTVLRGRARVLPGVKRFRAAYGAADGGYDRAPWYDGRALSFNCLIKGSSIQDARDKLDALLLKLDPTAGAGTIKSDLWNDRYYVGLLEGDIDADVAGAGRALLFTLNFWCADPHAYGTTAETEEYTIESNPDTFSVPSDVEVVVGGNRSAAPVWVVQNESGGIGSVYLLNSSTNESITVSGVPDGYYMRYDWARQSVEISSDGAGWSPAFDKVGAHHEIPGLRAGVTNTVSVGGLTAGTLTVTWRARWI